jgi:hypothetical protein
MIGALFAQLTEPQVRLPGKLGFPIEQKVEPEKEHSGNQPRRVSQYVFNQCPEYLHVRSLASLCQYTVLCARLLHKRKVARAVCHIAAP